MNGHNLSKLLVRAWLRAFLVVVLCTLPLVTKAAPGERNYTVRRGDTLSGIAHTHGIPLARLTERNDLSANSRIFPGQRLVIPPKVKKAETNPGRSGVQAANVLPSTVQKAIDSAAVRRGRWKYIVIHHSGAKTGTMAGMDRYHREVRHMENGLAYHFVIGNAHGLGDGQVGVGRRWTKQLDGGHLISEAQNKVSIGICLVGNFDRDRPTALQMQRLTTLVRAIMKRCHLPSSAIKTHQEINLVNTRCPGRHFPLQRLLNSLESQTASAD